MPDTKQLLRQTRDRIAPPPDVLGGLERRRRRRENVRRVTAVVVGIAVAVAGITGWLALSGDGGQTPADDSRELGIFAPVAGRIVYVKDPGIDVGYDQGIWGVDPFGPSDTTDGPSVADDAASTLVRLGTEDAEPMKWSSDGIALLGWSSDGTELLFMRSKGDPLLPQQHLYILHADGSETQVTTEPVGGAAISPDGSRVAYSADGLYVVDVEGGQPVRVAQEGSSPTFSPDGRQIAYLFYGDSLARNVDEEHVWVVNADGTDAHEILADEETVFVGVSGLRWSPAGDRLAFGVGGAEGTDALAIYTFAPDGSDFTRVITGGESPFWSPDGSQIAYTILCEEQPTDSCPEGSILRSQYDAQPSLFGGGSAGLAIADADGSDVREFGFAASGPWHPAGSVQADEPTVSGAMWPQSSLQEAQEAQELADDGDPRYTWQVLGLGASTDGRQTEFVTRFLQEELGWEEFDVSVFPGLYAGVPQDGLWEMLAVRCAPGQTNSLYPDDPQGRGCAPTIDEYRYETVMINAEPPVRMDDPTAIWVVTKWAVLQPSDVRVTGTNYRDDSGAVFRRQVQQVVPPSDADSTALVEAFLQARVDGEGAEGYLSPASSQVDLLYATTSGDPYQRSEFQLVRGPVWPGGWREFKVRLFAAGGSNVVEQSFLVERDEDGRLVVVHAALDPFEEVLSTENGGALAEPYEFLDGEVTFAAAHPWGYSFAGWQFGPFMETLLLDSEYEQRFQVHADPRPVETGCRKGPATADAEALAESIRSDPDLEATAPESVVVGGTTALRMDVVAAPGASLCQTFPAPMVLSDIDLDRGERMRLYLLDLPVGSGRILAIAISAPEASFEHVVEAAEPIVDSFEFHTG